MDAAALFQEGRMRTTDPARREELDRTFLRAAGEAIRFDPGALEPRYALLNYHRFHEDIQSASVVCEEILRMRPSKEIVAVAHELAGLNLQGLKPGDPRGTGRVDMAYRLLSEIVEIAPNLADGHRELARLMLFHKTEQRDQLQSALAHARTAVELDPHAPNFEVLSLAFYRLGNIGESRQALLDGLRVHPDDKRLQEQLMKLSEKYRE